MNSVEQFVVRRGKAIGIIVALAVFAFVAISCVPRACAEEMKGQFFIPISARYIEDWGVAGGVAYQEEKTKMIFSLQVSYDQFNGQGGSVPYQVNPCRVVQVPWSTPDYGHRGIEFTLLIPVGKKK